MHNVKFTSNTLIHNAIFFLVIDKVKDQCVILIDMWFGMLWFFDTFGSTL